MKKLKELEDKGNSLLSVSKKLKQAIEDKKKEIADLEAELKELTEKRDTVADEFERDNIAKELGMVPTDVDMTGNSEYQALKATIEEKEKALADENDTSELIRSSKRAKRTVKASVID